LERITLARLAAAPAYGFDYAYQIPSNVLRINDEENAVKTWKREGDHVLSNEPTLNVQVLKRERDTTKWPPLFTEAVIASLAADLAGPITKTASLVAIMAQKAEAAIANAQFNEGQETTSDEVVSRRLIDVRY
jgi:hypothetical protein